jgi:outer membrane protein OmpA-like peptidoglycan-associated protein
MRYLITGSLLSVAVALGGCAREAGYHPTSVAYGPATQANFEAQDAYGRANERLRNLADDFRANTQDTVTFAFNRANIDSTARKALDGQAKWLRENPGVRMTIVGHTDLVGSERYNDRLGLRRARAVIAYLSRRGVSRKRLDAVESQGERNPVVQTEQRERRNRRAVTTVAGFARNYVGTGLDGEVAQRVYDTYQTGNFSVTEADSGEVN